MFQIPLPKIVETERLCLRPWQETDAESLYLLACDPDVGPAAGWLPHRNVESSRTSIRGVLAMPGTYAVTRKQDSALLGSVSVFRTRAKGSSPDEPEIGYWIGKAYWGHGYATEAVRAVLSLCFAAPGVDRVWCGYYDENERSRRTQEKCGFEHHHTESDRLRSPIGESSVVEYAVLSRQAWAEHFRPYELRMNLRREPWDVPADASAWRFSWQVQDEQVAYRLCILRGVGCEDAVPLYDTGWVMSGRTAGVALPENGIPSQTSGLYRWQVQTRDRAGNVFLSKYQPFTVFDDAAWRKERGIWPAVPNYAPEGCVPGISGFVRQSFFLTQSELSDTVYAPISVTARSPEPARQYVCTLYVNGYPLLVAPPRYGCDAQGHRLLFVQTVDMRKYLHAGENVVAAVLACPGAEPIRMFACRAVAFLRDGCARALLSPQAWRGLDGAASLRPRHSVGTGYFTAYAQDIDGTVFPFGFAESGFDDSGWHVCVDRGLLSAGLSEGEDMVPAPSGCDPVSRYVCDGAPQLIRLEKGHYLADLGQEIVGSVELDVPDVSDWYDGTAEVADISLYLGEQIGREPNGGGVRTKWCMNTGNHYRFAWRLIPGKRFSTTDMMTFRFVELTGLPFDLTPTMLRGVAVRRAFHGELSRMDCSSQLLRDLWRMTRDTVKYTTQDIYVDSQSRERGPYEGDVLINQLAAYSFERDYATARFSLEYLYAHRTWPAEYTILITEAAHEDYMVTGDDSSLRRWYPVLREKTFSRFLNPDTGLLRSGNQGASGTDAILVDWPPSERDGYDMAVLYNTVFNCVAVAGYRALAQIAAAVGETDDSLDFAARAAALRESVLKQLYDPQTGDFYDGLYPDGTRSAHVSQHTAAYALYAGVYRDDTMADRIARRLWECSLRPDAGVSRIRMSVYGAYFLLMGLYRTGHGDMANSLLTDEDDRQGRRTFAYMLRRSVGDFPSPFDGQPIGATLTTEAWNTDNKPNMTFSHPWGAAAAVAIVRGVFGVSPTSPGYADYSVHPQAFGISGELTLPTVRGVIRARLPRKETEGT